MDLRLLVLQHARNETSNPKSHRHQKIKRRARERSKRRGISQLMLARPERTRQIVHARCDAKGRHLLTRRTDSEKAFGCGFWGTVLDRAPCDKVPSDGSPAKESTG